MRHLTKRFTTAFFVSMLSLTTGISFVFADEDPDTNWDSDDKDMPMFISDSNTGYIDNAIIQTQSRIRLDAGFENTLPDRAEFFYGACGCARDVPGLNTNAPGPSGTVIPGDIVNSRLIETDLDYIELSLDYEHAITPNFSVFAELPVKFVDGKVVDNEKGLGDIKAGFKVGLIKNPSHHLTFQLRGYFPTGDAKKGLGTDHVSYEPGLLHLSRLGTNWTLASELRYWIPVGGTTGFATGNNEDYAGKILRYGMGAGYDINLASGSRITPVLELVGWKIFGGQVLDAPSGTPATAMYKEVEGTVITNLKFGARFSFHKQHSAYIGYGKSLTDNTWYEDIYRVEFRTTY